MTDPREQVREAVERVRSDLLGLSHTIHANPELGYAEEQAAGWLSNLLAGSGMRVERGVGGLPTAFVARAGRGPLHIAFLAEYDALPSVGHACGHNIIAAASAGAGIALARVADELDLTVSVIGAPAEEGGAGKVVLIEQGVFDDVHAALMVHPAPADGLRPEVLAAMTLDIRYRGKEAHAALAPWEGINAADALVVGQVAIGLLRQHLHGGDHVHGIVTSAGVAPNIVPADAGARYMIRSRSTHGLARVRERVERCFDAGAIATGASLEISAPFRPYAHMAHDDDLLALYERAARSLGRTFDPSRPPVSFSTDMGNVSLLVPSIHPVIGIETAGAVNHQPEFAAACVSASADRAVIDGAVALAWTAVDAASDPSLRHRLLTARSGTTGSQHGSTRPALA
jgi:amidohydrolase